MTPNQDQYLMLLRAIMLIVGPLVIAHGVSQPEWDTLSTGVQAIVGSALTIGPIVWGMFSHTQKATLDKIPGLPPAEVLKEVVKIPEVRQVKVSNDKIADAVPNDKVVHAP